MSTVWFDITTSLLLNRPAAGVVRAEIECIKYFMHIKKNNIRFCHFIVEDRYYKEIQHEEIQKLIDRISAIRTELIPTPPLTRKTKIKKKVISLIQKIPGKPGRLIWNFMLSRKDAFKKAIQGLRTARIAFLELTRACVLFAVPRKTKSDIIPREMTSIELPAMIFRKDDIYVSMGLDWDYKDWSYLNSIKKNIGFRIMLCCHDIMLKKIPHVFYEGVDTKFVHYYEDLAACADEIFCVSEHTKNDFYQYLTSQNFPTPAMSVIKWGCELPKIDYAVPITDDLKEILFCRYILFVSTIERRKNHEVLYRAYIKLIEQGETDLPLLVFIGMPGWGVSDFLNDLRRDPRIQGHIKILNHISDADLIQFYQNAYFTVYPSLYEGWGLPVAESLAMGKFCLASNATSLPEVGGDFLEYIDPWDTPKWTERLKWYFDHPEEVAKKSSRIVEKYKPTPWCDVAAQILTQADQLKNSHSSTIVS